MELQPEVQAGGEQTSDSRTATLTGIPDPLASRPLDQLSHRMATA